MKEGEFGWTPLFVASVEGNMDCVQLLVKAGAETSLFDNMEWTAFDHAVFRGHMKIAEYLKQHMDHSIIVSDLLKKSFPSPKKSRPLDFSKDETIKTYGHNYLKDECMVLLQLF